MKTDKEYPATHSMSTSWFGIDKEGYVALIEFNENGPVPCGCGDHGLPDLISDVFSTIGKDGIRDMNYTKEQALELCQRLLPPTTDLLRYECIVRIDLARREEFKRICCEEEKKSDWSYPYIIISEEVGLYKVYFYDWHNRVLRYVIENKIIIGVVDAEIDTNDVWDEAKDRWVFSNDMAGYPYYLYQQPYWTGQLTERTYIPTFPMKADQLSESARGNALQFPINFNDCEAVQIAQFFQCDSYAKGEASYEGFRKLFYYQYPSVDGREMMVRSDITGLEHEI